TTSSKHSSKWVREVTSRSVFAEKACSTQAVGAHNQNITRSGSWLIGIEKHPDFENSGPTERDPEWLGVAWPEDEVASGTRLRIRSRVQERDRRERGRKTFRRQRIE